MLDCRNWMPAPAATMRQPWKTRFVKAERNVAQTPRGRSARGASGLAGGAEIDLHGVQLDRGLVLRFARGDGGRVEFEVRGDEGLGELEGELRHGLGLGLLAAGGIDAAAQVDVQRPGELFDWVVVRLGRGLLGGAHGDPRVN